MNTIEKVKSTISEYKLIKPGELVLAAVSGGPDSLVMLEILHRLKGDFGYELHVVHLNHKLRKEADAEAKFVREFARIRSIPARILEKDISTYLTSKGGSLQDTAREIRYSLFNQIADEIGASRIALGHHSDDLAETVLMRFLRGASLEGLMGFSVQGRGRLIRPLINLTRKEIEDFCMQEGLAPCYDMSNTKPIYLRNKIRLDLIPKLEKEYNPNLREQLVQMSHLLNEENSFIEEYATRAFNEATYEERPNVLTFKNSVLMTKKPVILRRIIRIGIEKLKGDKKNFYYHHLMEMQRLILHGSPGKMLILPDGYLLYRGYNWVKFGKREEILARSLSSYELSIPGQVYIEELDLFIKAELHAGKVLAKGDQAAIDAEFLENNLIVRSRKPGDWFCPLGLTGKKKVKDFFIDIKVDRLERDLIPIVTTLKGEIVWIAGHRLDERYKVRSTTQKTCILTILKEGYENA